MDHPASRSYLDIKVYRRSYGTGDAWGSGAAGAPRTARAALPGRPPLPRGPARAARHL